MKKKENPKIRSRNNIQQDENRTIFFYIFFSSKYLRRSTIPKRCIEKTLISKERDYSFFTYYRTCLKTDLV